MYYSSVKNLHSKMRKFIVVFLTILIFIVALVVSNDTFSLKELFAKNVSNVNNQSIDFGFLSQMYDGKVLTYSMDGKIVGQGIEISGIENLNKICDLIGLKVNQRYMVDNIEMIEGFSAVSPYTLPESNNNIQISISGDVVTVASPIIYGSY